MDIQVRKVPNQFKSTIEDDEAQLKSPDSLCNSASPDPAVKSLENSRTEQKDSSSPNKISIVDKLDKLSQNVA